MAIDKKYWDGEKWDAHRAFNTIDHHHGMKKFFTRPHGLKHSLVLATAFATILVVDVLCSSAAATAVGLAFQLWCVLGPADK